MVHNCKIPYRKYYPDNVIISKNSITSNTYRKIRECFKQHYIRENFDKPLQPREEEFLQWIKKFLNNMEERLLSSHD